MTLAVSSIILLLIMASLISEHGWIVLWNSFFVAVLLITLVLAQKYIGKIEGLMIAVIPFIGGQILIRKNRTIQQYYFSKQMKFLNWCNKYLYDFSGALKK